MTLKKTTFIQFNKTNGSINNNQSNNNNQHTNNNQYANNNQYNSNVININNSSSNSIDFSEYLTILKKIGHSYMNMISKPISSIISKKVNSDLKLLLISGSILALIFSIFSTLSIYLFSESKGLALINLLRIIANISYIKVFFCFLSIFIVSLLLLWGVFNFTCKKIFKSNINNISIINIIILASVPLSLSTLLQALFSIFSIEFGLIILFIGFIASIIYLYRGFKSKLPLDEDKFVLLFLSYYIILVLVDLSIVSVFFS